MSYTILLTGPANAGKRNLAARIANELVRRDISVRPLDEHAATDSLRIHPRGVRLVISDGPQTMCLLGDKHDSEDLLVEMHVLLPDSGPRNNEPPEVVIHAGKDGLKTGLNRIMHFLETHRLVPEKRSASVYSDLYSAVTGSTTQIFGPPRT